MKLKHTLVSILTVAVFGGCGGGTGGTGLTSIQGAVETTDSKPLVDAKVTVVETGDTTTTNGDGQFDITSEVSDPQIEVRVEKGQVDTSFVVQGAQEGESRINVLVKLDSSLKVVNIDQFDVHVSIVGKCAGSFENKLVIRQTKEIATNSTCRARAVVYGDGQKRPLIPVAVQYRSCSGTNGKLTYSFWKTLATGLTENGAAIGVAEIDFPYIESDTFCEYRVVAPYQYGNETPLEYPIRTLVLQRKGG